MQYNKTIFVAVTTLMILVAGTNIVYAQEIPGWIKGIANFWAEDKISDAEYLDSLKFLIDAGIIQMDNSTKTPQQADQEAVETNKSEQLESDIEMLLDEISELHHKVEEYERENRELKRQLGINDEWQADHAESVPQCDEAYPGVCIAPYPPDLDCKDIPHTGFEVNPPDPHGFDVDGDGFGCTDNDV